MKTEKSKQGKKNRAAGVRFELKVRKDLEEKKWLVDKWTNNIEFHNDEDVNEFIFTIGKMVPAKNKFRGKGVPMMLGSGFPDFVCFRTECTLDCKKIDLECHEPCIEKNWKRYEVIGCEVKSNGILTKEEKAKAKWYLDNNVFSKILIASKGKRGEIEYKEFENEL